MKLAPVKVQLAALPKSIGGPRTFLTLLMQYINRSSEVEFSEKFDSQPNIIFISGGSRRIFWLMKHKIKGTKIVQRLNGVNIIKFSGLNFKYYLISKVRNFLLGLIRNYFADFIIYQTYFSKLINDQTFGEVSTPFKIINNGASEKKLPSKVPLEKFNVCCIEGNYSGSDYENTLLAKIAQYVERNNYIESFQIYGGSNQPTYLKEIEKIFDKTTYFGRIENINLAKIYNDNAILFSIDLDHACSNSIIEALSYGIPVAAMNTGGNSELLLHLECGYLGQKISKRQVENNEIEFSFMSDVERMLDNIIENYSKYSKNAKKRFNQEFEISFIARKYKDIFLNLDNT